MPPNRRVRASECGSARPQRPGLCHRSLANRFGTADHPHPEPANGESRVKQVGVDNSSSWEGTMRKGARFLRFAALALLTGSLVGPSCGGTALAASPFNVNDPTDATDSNIGDGLCDISAMGPCTLRAAIQEANAAANCSTNPQQTMQTINVPPGTYNLDRTVQGIPFEGEDNSTIGDLDINTHVTINGAGASATIVDAKQNDRVLDIFGRPAAPMQPEIRCTVRIVGISVTNGRITQAGSQGAGIKNLGVQVVSSIQGSAQQSSKTVR
jgi:CSLREA domain-containing protein